MPTALGRCRAIWRVALTLDARLLAAHMGNHIPGKPEFIVQSMPGAGGLLATNYLYTQAPQDGTTIGLIHSTVPLAPDTNMATRAAMSSRAPIRIGPLASPDVSLSSS